MNNRWGKQVLNTTSSVEFKRKVETLNLPEPWQMPEGTLAPNVRLVRVCARRIVVAGHNPIDAHGNVTGPFGVVGETISLEQAQRSSAATMRGILASLRQELGDLSRIGAWIRMEGWVNAARGFKDLPAIMNPASEIVYDLFGAEIGAHARYVVGVTGLPFGAPVELAAELELAG
ncbi:MAG: RidA family protein [Gammaproteobacteria bacterium]